MKIFRSRTSRCRSGSRPARFALFPGSANGRRAEPPTPRPGPLWVHVMKVFSVAKPEFDPILMLQNVQFSDGLPCVCPGYRCRLAIFNIGFS